MKVFYLFIGLPQNAPYGDKIIVIFNFFSKQAQNPESSEKSRWKYVIIYPN